MTAADERELLCAARLGDRAAFALLVQRHRPLLLALCYRILRDADLAEDASQEAALRALLSLQTLRRAERFGPWLAGIGLNVCRQWARQRMHTAGAWSWEALTGGRLLDGPVDADPQVQPEQWAEERDLAGTVHRAVNELPPGQRAAVLLFYLAGLSHRETAAALGVPVGAIKTRLHKARLALRASLWNQWNEEKIAMTTRTESTTDYSYVDVRILDVLRTPETPERSSRSIMLLEESDGGRILPIWVGLFEGDATVVLLEQVELARPLTFTFAANLLRAAGGTLREVRINRLTAEDGTFYAQSVVDGQAGTHVVDCRPSDAICLALAIGAPIRVATEVMAAAAQVPEQLPKRPEGTLTATEVAQSIRATHARLREEWTKTASEQVRPRDNP